MTARVSLLGVGVHAVDLEQTLDAMQAAIDQKHKGFICLAPAHNLMAGWRDKEVRNAINRSVLTVPDGMGTVWFLRALGHNAGRVYGPDLLLAAVKRGAPLGWRHAFVGGSEATVAKLGERLTANSPDIKIAGMLVPPFDAKLDDEVMAKALNAQEADILWVALGSPRQELWMAEMSSSLKATLLVGVGAAFDFLAGTKPQAPAWTQRTGLEWLFRLLTEPRRLWRRYADYPLFVLLAFAQVLGLKRYPIEGAS
jgi:N-acetylglucosaminyldiphosphoundecaprenol N-acetyl-beta-D-mannosaminyltransferase